MRYDKVNRRLEKIQNEADSLRRENESLQRTLKDVMHEVRSFNNEISSQAETLSRSMAGSASNKDNEKSMVETILYTSGLVSARMGFADITLNPNLLRTQAKYTCDVYRKFDKVRYILARTSKNKFIEIDFKGKTDFSLQAIKSFDLLPYLLIDNAIKYSPKHNKIEVEFEDYLGGLSVTVTSLGPVVEKDEIEKLYDREYRSKNAVDSNFSGQGLGLHLADKICSMYNIKMNVTSGHTITTISEIPYSTFEVKLEFKH